MVSDLAIDFAAGCIGGAAGVLAGYPLDTVKVRLQTQTLSKVCYKNTFHCITSIIQKNGFCELYKGLSSPLASIALLNAIIFSAHGSAIKYLKSENGDTSYIVHFFAGGAAGSAQAFLASPMEMFKLRVQARSTLCNNMPSTSSQSFTPFQCFKQIVKEKNFFILNRGLLATQIRDFTGVGTYFVSYEFFSKKLIQKNESNELNSFELLMAGGLAGIASWLCNYPVDVIKTQIQVIDTKTTYTQIIKKIYTECGWRGFFVGLGSTLLRAFPTNAAIFFTIEWTYRLINKYCPTLINSNKELPILETFPKTGNNNQNLKKFKKNQCLTNRRYILLSDLWSKNSFLLPEAGSTSIDPIIYQCRMF